MKKGFTRLNIYIYIYPLLDVTIGLNVQVLLEHIQYGKGANTVLTLIAQLIDPYGTLT